MCILYMMTMMMIIYLTNCVDHFNMPLKVYNDIGKLIFIHPTSVFQKAPKEISEIKVDENFYVEVKGVSQNKN